MAKAKVSAIAEENAVYVLQAGTPIYVKTADICAITGKSQVWIGNLTSDGTINKSATPHGSLYNLTDTLKAYISILEERGDGKDSEIAKLEKEKLKSEATIKRANAVKAGLLASELQGKMHRSEDVEAATEDLVYAIRAGLVALPSRLSRDVYEAESISEVAEVIKSAVYELMEELSRYKYSAEAYEARVRERLKLSEKEGNEQGGQADTDA
jgi:hypothetical protein